MKRLSRIQAVNEIIKMRTAERVSSEAELETLPQAVSASDDLDMAVTHILTDFIWYFNTIENGVLTSDTDGIVTLPDSLTHLAIHSTDASVAVEFLRPVGGQIYDTYNHTNNIGTGRTVRYSGKMEWAFEDLPVAFQFLAIAHARKEIAGSGAHFSAQRLVVEETRFNEAFQTASKFDGFLSGGRIREPQTNRRRAPHNQGWL